MPLVPNRWRRPLFGGGAARGGYSAVMVGATLGGCCNGSGGLSNEVVERGVTTEGTEGHRGFVNSGAGGGGVGCLIVYKTCLRWGDVAG